MLKKWEGSEESLVHWALLEGGRGGGSQVASTLRDPHFPSFPPTLPVSMLHLAGWHPGLIIQLYSRS